MGNKRNIDQQKSFTLIELLIVIAIITIIAGAVLVAINPAKRIAKANDSQRWAEVQSLSAAISTYVMDNKGDVPDCGANGNIPADGIYRWIGTEAAANDYIGDSAFDCRAAWLMDDSLDDGIMSDSTGNGNDGTCTDCPVLDEGQYGGGYFFEADNELCGLALPPQGSNFIEINDSDDLDLNDRGTITFWLKMPQEYNDGWPDKEVRFLWKGGEQSLVGPCNNAEPRDPFSIYNMEFADSVRFTICSDNIMRPLDIPRPKDGLWHLYTFTWDDLVLDSVYAYLDDELINETQAISMRTDNNSLWMGRTWMNYWCYLNGVMDEVAIFGEVLSPSEIAEIYEFGINAGLFCDLTNDLKTNNGYLPSIPTDPVEGNINNSGYLVKRDPSGSITIKAPYASDYAEKEIMVAR